MMRVWKRIMALAMCLALGVCGLGLAEQPKEFVDAPKGANVYGVTAGEPLRMGVALARAAEGIAARFDAADFDIWGADELLSGAEYSAFVTLDPVERVLAVLIMAGYAEETYDAISELGLEISGEAQALVKAVYKRYSGMSKGERGAWNAAVERGFRRGDGAQITLRIGEQLVRYSFQADSESWVLSGISIAQ